MSRADYVNISGMYEGVFKNPMNIVTTVLFQAVETPKTQDD